MLDFKTVKSWELHYGEMGTLTGFHKWADSWQWIDEPGFAEDISNLICSTLPGGRRFVTPRQPFQDLDQNQHIAKNRK